MTCKDTGMCKTATACFLGGCQDERAVAPLPSAMGVDYCAPASTGECSCRKFGADPFECENAVRSYAAPLPAAPAPTELAGELPPMGERLPKLPAELYECYPSMSAQNHERMVKDYARAALAARHAATNKDNV